jgi:DNA-binding beta-propeller fold protein YncE
MGPASIAYNHLTGGLNVLEFRGGPHGILNGYPLAVLLPTGVVSYITLTNVPGGTATVGFALDSAGNLWAADALGNRVGMINPFGVWTTVASTGLNAPSNVCCSPVDGSVYVTERRGYRVLRVSPDGNVSTLAGSLTAGFVDGVGSSAGFEGLAGCVVDSAGNVVVADKSRIRRVTPAGAVNTIAGAIFPAYADGVGTYAQFSSPQNMVYDSAGNLFVTDYDNAVVRVIAPDGNVVSIGNSSGFAINASAYKDGSALQATFTSPFGIAIDPAGKVYVSDLEESVIRVINVARVTPATVTPPAASRSGAILGLLALLALIPLAALVCFVLHRARRRGQAAGKPLGEAAVSATVSIEAFLTDVTLDALLGEGGFATVYSARWCGTKVAAKVLKRSVGAVALRSRGFDMKRPDAFASASAFLSVGLGSEDVGDAIGREIALLSQLRHPNIVSLVRFRSERDADASLNSPFASVRIRQGAADAADGDCDGRCTEQPARALLAGEAGLARARGDPLRHCARRGVPPQPVSDPPGLEAGQCVAV